MEKNISYQDYIKLENEFKKKEKSMEERLWIDSNVGLFDNELRSNYNKPLEEFSEVIIEYLAKLTNAYQGVLYILSQDDKVLEAVAGYACSVEKLEKQEYEFGEGLVGQAAASKQEIIFEDLPPQNENNVIGEVQLHPKAVIIIPLLFNESVYGILKLVYLKSVDEKFKHLLTRTSQNIGAMLESILNSSKLQSLLKDSQEQTEKLLSQEEELRQNLEEMEATREAQEQAQNELEKLKNNLEKEVAQQTLKLEESIQKFDLATATTTEGIWDLVMPEDLQTNDDTYFWWSDNFRKMLGYKNEEDFPNRLASWSDLLHPDHKERTLEAFSAHLMDYSGNTPYNVEYQLLRKTGEYRWYRAVGNTLRDDSGKPLRVAGSLIDIQEAKDLEVVRKDLVEKFDLATATTTEGIWDLVMPEDLQTNDDTYFWWSDNFRKMLGYKNEEDFPNRLASWSDLLHPDHKERTLEAFSAHLMDYSGNTPYNVEYQLLRKTGEYRWYRAVGNTLRDDSGKPLRVAGSLIDIQEAKDLEVVRKEQIQKFDLVTETTIEGLWDIIIPSDLQMDDNSAVWWSDRFRSMLGYENDEELPKVMSSWTNAIHPDQKEAVLEAFGAHLMDFTGNTPYDSEFKMLRKTGEYRWYRAIGNTLRDKDGKPLRIAGSMIDIQENKELEAVRKELVERFDLAANTATEGLWDMTMPDDLQTDDDTYFWWSDVFRQMLGYKDEEDFPNKLGSWSNLLHTDHKQKTLDAFAAHLMDFTGNTPYDVEYQLLRKTGEYRWYRAVGNTLRDESGKPLRVAGTLIDIQESKDLNQIQERFDLAIETSKEALWFIEFPEDLELKDDTPFWWADSFRKMLGYENETEFPNIFSSWTSKIHPDDKEAAFKAVSDHLMDLSGNTPYDEEYRLKHKSGKYIWFRSIGKTIRDKDGKPIKTGGTMIDIQHLKDLEENRKNYEVFASVLKEGLWSTRLNGNSELKPDLEINWSPQCHQLFGFESYDEFPNRFDSWSSRIHRSDKKETLSKLQAFFNNPDQDTLSELTHRLKSKSGKYEPYNMEVVKQKDGNYTKIVGSISRLPA